MTDQSPFSVGEPEWERGLWWMVIVSGTLHVLAIAALVLIPHTFLHRPPRMTSYTVDLIAPDKIGGTNMVAGGKGRVEKAPMAAAPKVEPPPPPPPKPEPPKVEPPKAEVVKPPEPPQEVVKVEPKPEAPKVEPKPKEDEVALAEKAKPAPPTVVKAAPSPQAKPNPSPKAVAKVEPQKPQPAPAPKVDTKAAKEAAAAKVRDEKIAAAIRKVEQQAGTRGGGTGKQAAAATGGPISVGPGEGAGGEVRGVEYLLYYNQMMNRIKQSWAWAGPNRSLEAVVSFNIADTGAVINVRITHPSGDPSFDASVERAVKAVNPLLPPPDAYRAEFNKGVELTFTPQTLQQ